MIQARELHAWAAQTLAVGQSSEVTHRRGVSALYYGLFHRLTVEGAALFDHFGHAMEARVRRGYDHGPMKKLCLGYRPWGVSVGKSPSTFFSDPVADPDLTLPCRSFVRLQEARHRADYDLTSSFDRDFCLELLELAEAGHWMLDRLLGSGLLTAFLSALTLADRLPKRG